MNKIIYIKSNKKLTHKAGVELVGQSRIDGKNIYKVDMILFNDTRPLYQQLGVREFELISEEKLEDELPIK
jgi:hypothetical protein